ncbi:MAG: ATP-dependent helicase C-terminal domain-containing protein, partial [Pseudomonadota bacterium]
KKAGKLANRWAMQAEQLISGAGEGSANPAICLALARPDMIARRRDETGEFWLSSGGRGYTLDPASPLARSEWIVIGDAQGQAKGARITAGAELSREEIESHFQNRIEGRSITHWNNDKNRVEARLERWLGAIRLTSAPDPDPDPVVIVDTLVDKALDSLGERLPDGFLARGRFAGVSALDLQALKRTADVWLVPILTDRRDLNIPPGTLAETILGQLDWNTRQSFENDAPTHFLSPANTRHAIDYSGDDAPSVEVRVQALFGLDSHPMIGNTPLLLKLTSPAGRPIQSTRDICGFWRGSWADVAKEMKGRYTKHRWPEQPWLEKPSLKTKNAFSRDER